MIARMTVDGEGLPVPTQLLSNYLSRRARIDAEASVDERTPTDHYRPVVACALTVVPSPYGAPGRRGIRPAEYLARGGANRGRP